MLWTIYLYCTALGKGTACTVESENLWGAQQLALSMNPGYEIYNPDKHC